jgi:hypothetical protein
VLVGRRDLPPGKDLNFKWPSRTYVCIERVVELHPDTKFTLTPASQKGHKHTHIGKSALAGCKIMGSLWNCTWPNKIHNRMWAQLPFYGAEYANLRA